jgi:DNA polymerase-3 subunit beta
MTLSVEGDRLVVRAGRSRFTLSTLPAAEFPLVEEINAQQTLRLPQAEFRKLIDKTHFSMAQQDVRYYLNGMLLESEGGRLRAVSTDGHRLALCEANLAERVTGKQQVILPRKGVLELQRMLGESGDMELSVGTNHVRCQIGDIRFTSKLIDGRFPEYSRVIPMNANRIIDADRGILRQSLQRTAILSNEKYRGIRLNIKPGVLTLQAHNPEQEEAEDQVEVTYAGEEIEIGFNVTYLLDALSAIETERVNIALTDANSSCLITAATSDGARYVVMPMRL